MKNMFKRFLSCICLICCVISTMQVQARETDDCISDVMLSTLVEYTVDVISDKYLEYYDINNCTTRIDDMLKEGNKVEVLMFISMDMVLKAQDVTEIPFVQGMLQCANIDTYNLKTRLGESNIENAVATANDSILSQKQISAVSSRINSYISNLSQYIGMVSDTNFYLKVSAEIENGEIKLDTINILTEEVDGNYIPIEAIFPKEKQIMVNQGKATIDYCLRNCEYAVEQKQIMEVNTLTKRASTSDMVNYMLKYTSNPANCYDHGSECGTKQDRTVWNNNEYYYYSNLCHNDCADYVSQALATYFNQDDEWYATKNSTTRSTTWVNTGKLRDHMVERGVFIEYDDLYNPLSQGSVVYTAANHVVMVTYADTIGLKYSGHTNDRKNVALSKSSIYKAYNTWW